MVKRIIILMALAALLGATAAEAVTAGKGKRGRNLTRSTYYATQLRNDKLAVYEEHGYPVHRLRERCAGRVVERWTYYELGLEFTFDESSTIVATRSFSPEDRRERIERFPEYRY
jgi:hypothetical protein